MAQRISEETPAQAPVLIKRKYERMLFIDPPRSSFYVAIGYSILLQLARVSKNMRKATLQKISDYLLNPI